MKCKWSRRWAGRVYRQKYLCVNEPYLSRMYCVSCYFHRASHLSLIKKSCELSIFQPYLAIFLQIFFFFPSPLLVVFQLHVGLHGNVLHVSDTLFFSVSIPHPLGLHNCCCSIFKFSEFFFCYFKSAVEPME